MINKDDILNCEFLKQFKDSKDFSSFMEELYVCGTEKMLEAESDHRLGYGKHAVEGRNSGNSSNGKTSKKLRSKYDEVEIEVPRDRAGTLELVVAPKRRGLAEGIEELIVSLYAKSMGTPDIEEQLREIYGFHPSKSTVYNIIGKVSEDMQSGSKGRRRPSTASCGWTASSSASARVARPSARPFTWP